MAIMEMAKKDLVWVNTSVVIERLVAELAVTVIGFPSLTLSLSFFAFYFYSFLLSFPLSNSVTQTRRSNYVVI